MTGSPPIRVCIVQPALMHYRVPLYDRLAASGIELEVWTDAAPTRADLRPVAAPTERFASRHAPVRTFGPLWWQPGMLEAARCGRFDVLLTGWNARFVHLAPALRAARRRGVRTILHGHGVSKRENALRRWRRNRVGRRADAVLLYGDEAARRLVREGFPESSVFVAPNAVDQAPVREAVAAWETAPRRLESFRREHGLAPGRTVVFISRLIPSKRVDLLLEAFALVAADRADARLAIIGDGPERAALEARAVEADLAGRVVFAGALYEQHDVAPWCLSAACMAYPGAIGLSLLHAFGYGLPVIAHDRRAGHGPEIEALRDGENGLLFREGDAGDLARRIGECLDDAPRRDALGAAALATVTGDGRYTLDALVGGFLQAIRAVVAR